MLLVLGFVLYCDSIVARGLDLETIHFGFGLLE